MKRQLTFFSILYFPLIFFIGILWVDASSFQNIIFFALWQLVMAKVIYDIVWLVTAYLSHDIIPKRLPTLSAFPSVALLYTCRDDIIDKCLISLKNQDYPNYDIFILDDSQETHSKQKVDQLVKHLKIKESITRVTVLRRNGLEGFKAGNLNNWLMKFGKKYKYFVIFDNDSLAEQNFITQLVLHAEHSSNEKTAIFQSVILPWNNDNVFVRWISALSPLYMMLIKRNGNRTGTAISFGHNNLHRTSAFQELGGFNQNLTSEDTAATFELDMIGYKTEIVDITSYESVPANISKYERRAVRWAAQTVTLFRQPWKQASGALKLELSRQMIYYIINTVFLIWVMESIWFFDENLSIGEQYQQIVTLSNYDKVYLASFILVICIIMIYFFLHFILAIKYKIHVLDYLGHLTVSSAVYFFTAVSITLALSGGVIGKRVSFNPSNIEARPVSIFGLINQMKIIWGGSLIALVQYLINKKVPWNYLGGVWALFIFITPIILFFSHKYLGTGEYHAKYQSEKQITKKNIPV